MADSSSRSRKRRDRRRKERRAKTPSPAESPAKSLSASPPSYSVEENSEGEWINARLNVKWPQPVDGDAISKHRYIDTSSESSAPRSRSRKRRSRRSKRDDRDQSDNSSSSSKKEAQYIRLSIGSSEGDETPRRERNRMQTSPQVSRRSHSGYRSDEGGRAVDSLVFDTRSELMRYKQSGDILQPPTAKRRGGERRESRSKKPSAADQRENEEYNRYYVGVRSRRNVEAKLKRPGEFYLYYEKPREDEVMPSIPLKIAYLSSASKAFHFIVQRFEHADGHFHYVVMQNKSDGKMFTSILALVKHYSLYSHVDTATGRLETFSVPH